MGTGMIAISLLNANLRKGNIPDKVLAIHDIWLLGCIFSVLVGIRADRLAIIVT